MAKVRTIEADRLWTVTGAFREIFICSLGNGEGYRLFQFAHIDESGYQKIREWGVATTLLDATEIAIGNTERQYG